MSQGDKVVKWRSGVWADPEKYEGKLVSVDDVIGDKLIPDKRIKTSHLVLLDDKPLTLNFLKYETKISTNKIRS